MKKVWPYILLYVFLTIIILPIESCQKENYSNGNDVVLAFSTDTLSFDTIFTTIGSTTKQLKIYNRSSKDVLLENVTLAGGRASRFRINVDGDTSMTARKVEILAGDSIFVLVQVSINPNDATEPFLVMDSIMLSNGQHILLSAYGRNAVYHIPPADKWYSTIDCEGWNHTLAHVFVGSAVVPEGSTLTLKAGDELFFADSAMLIVDSNATLITHGTAEEPVRFTSLRNDGWYSFLPGQWQAIWFYHGSKDNIMDYCVVEKGMLGIVVDSSVSEEPTLTITNSIVRNMSNTGIMSRTGWVKMHNILVYQCGVATLWVRYGGQCEATQSTFAGYWRYGSRNNPTVVLNNWYSTPTNQTIVRPLVRADFTDCIIYGDYYLGEVLIDENKDDVFDYSFSNCIVKGSNNDKDPLFNDIDNDDYTLKEGSPAEGLGYQKP